MKNLILRFQIEEDNRKSEKRSNKNSYEAKVNVIEDSKVKASTFKGLKRKETAPGYKDKDQEVKNQRFKGLAISAIRRDTRRMNVAFTLKRTRSVSHR